MGDKKDLEQQFKDGALVKTCFVGGNNKTIYDDQYICDPQYATILDLRYLYNLYCGRIDSSNVKKNAVYDITHGAKEDDLYKDNTFGSDEDGDTFNRNENYKEHMDKIIDEKTKEFKEKQQQIFDEAEIQQMAQNMNDTPKPEDK